MHPSQQIQGLDNNTNINTETDKKTEQRKKKDMKPYCYHVLFFIPFLSTTYSFWGNNGNVYYDYAYCTYLLQ